MSAMAQPVEIKKAEIDTSDPRHASIELVTKSYGDSVVLRWGPSKPGAWTIANKLGYIVERAPISETDLSRPVFTRVSPGVIKPWPLDEWKRRIQRENRYGAIAAQMLYGSKAKPDAEAKSINSLRDAAQELQNRHGFSLFAADNDAIAAEGLGLRITDRDVRPGQRFIYRVYVAEIDPTYRIDSGYAVVDITPATKNPAPLDLQAEGRDGRVVLTWKDYPGASYSGYRIYRADAGSENYKEITSTPVITVTPVGAPQPAQPSYHDTTIVNYKQYKYRVVGVSPFAELSDPAEVAGYGRDLTAPPAPSLQNPEQTGRGRVKLTWTMPSNANLNDLNGFVIARSNTAVGGFAQITPNQLPKNAREFTDNAATPDEPYYMVGAVDTAGNVAPSLTAYVVIIDSLPPAAPKGLRASVDTNGFVTLKWNLGPEPDIVGYRVLWANDPTHEFTQRTNRPIQDTFFVDTISLKSLTPYVYYRIAALDDRYNHSEMSEMIAVKRPDIIPPDASVFSNVFVTDSMVDLRWNVSTSIDLKEQRLYRREGEAGVYKLYRTFGPKISSFIDRDVKQTVVYDYQLETVDSSGLVSERAMAVRGRPYDPGTRPDVQGLRAALDNAGNIRVTWSYPKPPQEKYWYVLYRSVGDHEPSPYKAIEQGKTEFVDNSLPQKGLYKYAVRVKTTKGGESMMTPVVTVDVK
jgi:fibronectin type 3 domain-containing protein